MLILQHFLSSAREREKQIYGNVKLTIVLYKSSPRMLNIAGI